jgi:Lon protease-like protein
LADDPFPRALVDELEEPSEHPPDLPLAETEQKLRRVLALMSEAGFDMGDTGFEVADQAGVAVQQLCALAPVSPLDAQELLGIDTTSERLARLQSLLDDEIAVLQQQLGSG